MKTEEKWALATYIISCISIATYMAHFWGPVGNILWVISGVCAIFCIYSGIIDRQVITGTDARSARIRGLLIGWGSYRMLGITGTNSERNIYVSYHRSLGVVSLAMNMATR